MNDAAEIEESSYTKKKTYVAETKEDVTKVDEYLLALENGDAEYMKIDLPIEGDKNINEGNQGDDSAELQRLNLEETSYADDVKKRINFI